MTLNDDIRNSISSIMSQEWTITQGRTVPSESDVTMTGKGVKLDGTVLYTDMQESSKLVDIVNQRVAGKVYQAFLNSLAKIITYHSGQITAYDGDRIMAIFLGDNKNTNAAECALKINYMVSKILGPMLTQHFKTLQRTGFNVSHCVGVDTGSFLSIKAGQRTANDLVWVGRAPNLAAKLSAIRYKTYTSFLSEETFAAMNDSSKYGGDNKDLMWTEVTYGYLGEQLKIYGSNWTWTV